MKKNILTLTMCLALTATTALAASSTAVINKPAGKPAMNAAPSQAAMKREEPKVLSKKEAKKSFEEKRVMERNCMYNELGLSAEQKTKAEDLDIKTRKEAEPIIKKLKAETKKYRDLKAKNASSFELWRQKQVVNSAKAKADKHFMASRNAFEAILTDEQKVKLKAYHAERKAKMEKFRKDHKLGDPRKHPGCNVRKHMGPSSGMKFEAPHRPHPIEAPPFDKK